MLVLSMKISVFLTFMKIIYKRKVNLKPSSIRASNLEISDTKYVKVISIFEIVGKKSESSEKSQKNTHFS